MIAPSPFCWPTNALAAFSRGSFLRPEMYTFAPFAARPCAMLRPIPVPPPVTSATRPLRSKILSRRRDSDMVVKRSQVGPRCGVSRGCPGRCF